ncbi:hypothetical protein F1C76_05765 [Geodermatophilaceae bacterium NBWT11]|nr:hypothetical protein F1C76_05765 [Geodermatophilaceae bacterium NBWT11]
MTAVLPPQVELPDPPGDPGVLAAARDDLAGAGFALGVAAAHLQGPAARAAEWLGADASAAALQTGTAAAVVQTLHDAVTSAVVAVDAHHDELVAARARLSVLRADQEADAADAQTRLAALVDPAAQVSSVVDPPGVAAVLDGFDAAEADRAAEHAALLGSVAEHAASTTAVLAGALAGVGGGGDHGGPTASAAVTLHLAVVLPGHGTSVLLDLGWEAARALTAPGTAAEVVAAADRYAPVLADPVVAAAAVVALGRSGLTQLLTQVGASGADGATDPLAGVLARTLGAAGAAGDRVPGAAPVLDGVLDPDDPSGDPDVVALGMGAVLAAPGAGADLAARWVRRLLHREAAQGSSSVDRTTGTGPDPVAVGPGVLTAAGRSDTAAGVLSDPPTWDALLGRTWPDGAADLVDLVELAGRSGAAAEDVVAAALTAAGADLLPGSARVLTVDPGTWAAVAPALTRVAVDHPAPLVAGLGSPGAPGSAALLSGAALLVSTEERRGLVATAVERAAAGTDTSAAVTGALVALEDHARWLAWLLPTVVARHDAAGRKADYDLLVTLPVLLVRGPWGQALQAGAGLLAPVLHADGSVARPAPAPVPTGPGGVAARLDTTPGAALEPAVLADALQAHDEVAAALALPVPLAPTPTVAPELALPDRTDGRPGRPVLPGHPGVGAPGPR